MDPSLSETDRAAVREALQEIGDEPVPPDRAPLGCAVALPGFTILLVFPVVGRMLSLGSAAAAVASGAGILLLVVGLGLWFSAGSKARRHAEAATEAALRSLQGGEGDRETALRAATLLLANAWAAGGPNRYQAVDVEDARRRLGGLLPLVSAVERFLLEEEAIYPLFTEGEVDDASD